MTQKSMMMATAGPCWPRPRQAISGQQLSMATPGHSPTKASHNLPTVVTAGRRWNEFADRGAADGANAGHVRPRRAAAVRSSLGAGVCERATGQSHNSSESTQTTGGGAPGLSDAARLAIEVTYPEMLAVRSPFVVKHRPSASLARIPLTPSCDMLLFGGGGGEQAAAVSRGGLCNLNLIEFHSKIKCRWEQHMHGMKQDVSAAHGRALGRGRDGWPERERRWVLVCDHEARCERDTWLCTWWGRLARKSRLKMCWDV